MKVIFFYLITGSKSRRTVIIVTWKWYLKFIKSEKWLIIYFKMHRKFLLKFLGTISLRLVIELVTNVSLIGCIRNYRSFVGIGDRLLFPFFSSLARLLSCQSAGVLQAHPAPVKGRVWRLHPIRFRLISLFFRVGERDLRHWVICSPLPEPCPPSLLSSTLLPIHLLWLCLWLWNTLPHDMHTHTLAGIKAGKKSAATECSSCPGGNANWAGSWLWRDRLNSPLKLTQLKLSKLWLQMGRGEFHCRFYRLLGEILPQHSGMMSLLKRSDTKINKTQSCIVGWWNMTEL